MRFSLLLLLSALGCVAIACIWDRDTLAAEAKGLPEVVRVVTGRFDRNPALYYEMRASRVEKHISREPRRFDLYDDLAVAYDRLGESDKAIEWMGRKEQVLKEAPDGVPGKKDALYKFYANIGTFYAHRWIRDGGDLEQPGDLEAAQAALTKAIEINPDAHFGREVFQLWAIEWLLDAETEDTLGEWIGDRLHHRRTEVQEAIEGISGLIVLGNAWESVDIFQALAYLLGNDHATLAHIASLRIQELLESGRKPLKHAESDIVESIHIAMTDEDILRNAEQEFRRLRAEAERYHERRTEFMVARLREGRHPDTDPRFWDGWVEPEPPEIHDASLIVRARQYSSEMAGVALVVGILAILAIGVILLRRALLTIVGGWRRDH